MKKFLMCAPTYFAIEYEINAWMQQTNQVDHAKALEQWRTIKQSYLDLGHQVVTIEPVAGLPDMIFTANAGQTIDNRALVANFKFEQRQAETAHFQQWFLKNGFSPVEVAASIWEGEGDCLPAGETIFAGYGFRSSEAAQDQISGFFNRPVIGLKLIDPYFYHLDTCFCPLDDQTIMYFPGAFDSVSQEKIRQSGFKLIEAKPEDARGFGLNAISDGHNVILSNHAADLITNLRTHGFNPIPVDVSEFKKSGGGVKCVTLELRS